MVRYSLDHLIGIGLDNQDCLIGISVEELPSSQTKKLYGYIPDSNQDCLIGYAMEGIELGSFDRSFY
jgi:hypothetical protein